MILTTLHSPLSLSPHFLKKHVREPLPPNTSCEFTVIKQKTIPPSLDHCFTVRSAFPYSEELTWPRLSSGSHRQWTGCLSPSKESGPQSPLLPPAHTPSVNERCRHPLLHGSYALLLQDTHKKHPQIRRGEWDDLCFFQQHICSGVYRCMFCLCSLKLLHIE